MKKEILSADEINSVTWVVIEKGAIFSLALMHSYLLSDPRLFLHPSWLDSISSLIYIGYTEQGLMLVTEEFGIVNLPTFCSLVNEKFTQVSKKSVSTTNFKENIKT